MSLSQIWLSQLMLSRPLLAYANPFDLRTVMLARHAQHVVLIHFPIALYLTGVLLDLAGLWLKRERLTDAAHYNFLLAALFVLPAVITGLLAWQLQLEGQKLKGTLLQHLVAGLTSAAMIVTTWIVQYRARRAKRPLPPGRFWLEAVGTVAVVITGHLGGFLSGVNTLN